MAMNTPRFRSDLARGLVGAIVRQVAVRAGEASMSCQEEFLLKLRERGFRLTPQREVVLGVLHDLKDHATVEEIFERVHLVSAAVDVATVYRTLELLQQLGLLAVVDLGDGLHRYELTRIHGTHHHLQCRRCGALIRLEQPQIQPFLDALRQQVGFAAEADHLIIPGLCQACQALERAQALASAA
jgi:Fur family transcriptional regulator, ferric uptake regulator